MEKELVLPEAFHRGRVLLHLDAVDAFCEVFVNTHAVGSSSCGYLPVICDITEALSEVNQIKVIIHDPTEAKGQMRGKQSSHPKGIWYTAQSGLWQTAWLESVPEHYIEWVVLQTKKGTQIKHLAPGQDPKVCFHICEGDEVEAVYAYCNLHGLWKA